MTVDATLPHRAESRPVRTVHVRVVDGPDEGLSKTAESSLSIGTDPSNDLVLTDETVSRFHIDLVRANDRILLTDHGSTNGTRLESAWLERAYISPKTTINLGRSSVRVDEGDPVEVELLRGDRMGGLLGQSDIMRQLMARIARAANSDASILLLGETGAGKEVVARAIHEASPRASKPFEIVDCGSVLPTLIGSELFGHEKGAYTGATHRRIGAFERADGGTLFLDEVGELHATLQVALLGALERRSFHRLGGEERIESDVRFICATNRDLRAEVNTRTFREDLFYRIAVVMLRIPPLRDRVDDIPLLAEHFLHDTGYRGPKDRILPAKVLSELERHRWPGNVRELRNAIETLVVMGEAPMMAESAARMPDDAALDSNTVSFHTDQSYQDARAEILERFEESYVRSLLDTASGNVAEAARHAGIARSYLNKIIRRRGIKLRRSAEDS